MAVSIPRETSRRRGRPTGWRAVPPHDLVNRVERARARIQSSGARPTQSLIAHELGISERTLRTYLGERRGF